MLCAVLVFVFLYMRNADMEVDMEIQSGAVIVRFYPLVDTWEILPPDQFKEINMPLGRPFSVTIGSRQEEFEGVVSALLSAETILQNAMIVPPLCFKSDQRKISFVIEMKIGVYNRIILSYIAHIYVEESIFFDIFCLIFSVIICATVGLSSLNQSDCRPYFFFSEEDIRSSSLPRVLLLSIEEAFSFFHVKAFAVNMYLELAGETETAAALFVFHPHQAPWREARV